MLTRALLNLCAMPAAAALTAIVLSEPVLADPADPASTPAAEARGAELAEGLQTITNPYLVTLHCMARGSGMAGSGGEATAEAAAAACEARAGARLAEIAREMSRRTMAEIEAAPETLEAAIALDGYALQDDLQRLSSSAAYCAAALEISATLDEVLRAAAAKRGEVLAAERARLDAAMEALDPERHGPADLPDCTGLDQGHPWLRPLLSHCEGLRQRFAARHAHLRCERLFEIAPTELRFGAFDVGGGETVSATSLLCDYGFDAEARARGGLFSASRIEVSLQLGPLDRPLTLTGTLHGPEGDDVWQLRDLSLSPGRLARDLDPDAPETLRRCLAEPASCQN